MGDGCRRRRQRDSKLGELALDRSRHGLLPQVSGRFARHPARCGRILTKFSPIARSGASRDQARIRPKCFAVATGGFGPYVARTGETTRRITMPTSPGLTAAYVGAAAALMCVAATPSVKAAGVVLTPHRAVYELKLLRSRGKREIESVRGRILYDFSGSPCAGYALNFRQVSELDSGENKTAMTDLRATTWEEGAAKRFRFSSENYLNDHAVAKVDGEPERGTDHVGVKLKKPADKSFDLDRAMVFPTEQIRRIIAAARDGKTVVEMPLYDGSDNGEKVYSTMTLIGRAIAPDEKV